MARGTLLRIAETKFNFVSKTKKKETKTDFVSF